MRKIERSAAFKKDIRRESKGSNLAALNAILPNVLSMLANDVQTPANYRDHKLTGKWEGCRECHVKLNLLLIYMKIDRDNIEGYNGELHLVRLGSHAELFG